MKTLTKINEELENLFQEIRALNKVLFNVDVKFSYKLKEEKRKIVKRIEFLKQLKKAYLEVK